MLSSGVDHSVWTRHHTHNRQQALLLLVAMTGFLGLLGYILLGQKGLWLMAIAAIVPLFLTPSGSPRLVLRLYNARQLSPAEAPALFGVAHELARRARLPRPPELFLVPSAVLNAFAVGHRDTSAIAVTHGLLTTLHPREIVGVLAHEISHVANNDLQVMGLADLITRMASVLSLIGQFFLLLNLPLILMAEVHVNWWAVALLVFAPQIMLLAQLGLSRTREFAADIQAVQLTNDPEALASALSKIEHRQQSLFQRLWPGLGLPQPSWLRTHPATEERIRRLLSLRPAALGSRAQILAAHFPSASFPRHPAPPRFHWTKGLWY
ncbi:MAG: peptidase M48 [Desulfovibrionales bacterium]|nr:MAG: peptidase M48 [Desulfovibrionales bacterium]